jgi:hypothetical protein
MKKCSPSLGLKEMQIKTPPTADAGEDVGRKEHLYTAGENTASVSGKQYGALKIQT